MSIEKIELDRTTDALKRAIEDKETLIFKRSILQCRFDDLKKECSQLKRLCIFLFLNIVLFLIAQSLGLLLGMIPLPLELPCVFVFNLILSLIIYIKLISQKEKVYPEYKPGYKSDVTR